LGADKAPFSLALLAMPFFPICKSDLKARGISKLDIILITGDAYIDHPAFGSALLARVLEAAGYSVGIIAQPDWTGDKEFLALGQPRLFFGITAGNMDSMINHYTAQRKRRNNDAYSPDARIGKRPDRAVMIYTNVVRKLFKGIPVIIGGIEASMRRIAHYDFWQDKIRNSILADSKADLLIYGMAEKAILLLADALDRGADIHSLIDIPGTVAFVKEAGENRLPDAELCQDKDTFLQMNRIFFALQQDKPLYQLNGGRYIRHNPPAPALTEEQMDDIYSLPFMRAPHPVYAGKRIPAWDQIRQSITSHRGCYGGCNYCAIAIHQGRIIQSRSSGSILAEAKQLKGTISDVGGPSANMYQSTCKLNYPTSCRRRSCIYPRICPNLIIDHDLQLRLLDAIAAMPDIKHVFVSSGIRHDLALNDKNYIKKIVSSYIGGRLKIAPEHSSPEVLALMGKPDIGSFEAFLKVFEAALKISKSKCQIVPYIIIGHPGTTTQHAYALKTWLKKHNIRVEQVQEFTPTPMTISTCMYYTGLDFDTGKPIHVPSPSEIRKQKELIITPFRRPQRKQRR
jgi:uncharacterized radical SAM protein YgiQ